MTLDYAEAQIAEIVKQIRQNTPPSARCPLCGTKLWLEPVSSRAIERDGDETELRGVQFDEHWDVLSVGFDCPDCGRGVGHVSLEQRARKS